MPAAPQSISRKDLATKNDPNSIKQGIAGYGVCSGLAVSAGTGLQVSIASGNALFASTLVIKSGATTLNLTAADSTNPRKDIIVLASDGTISAVDGTAAAIYLPSDTKFQLLSPYPEAIPSGKIILAEVYVAAGATSLAASDINDKRVLLSGNYKISTVFSADANGITFKASDGTTTIAVLDDSGNWGIKGMQYTL
jgi:hypothetical protein